MQHATQSKQTELEQAIERHIAERTWGRIHRLLVEPHEDRMVVHGYTSSYYIKQLAIQAVLEALGPGEDMPVEIDIEVGSSDASASQGRDASLQSV